MVKSEPHFAVMDGGRVRPLPAIEHDDALRKALFQAIQAWRNAAAHDASRTLWHEPGAHYVIVPSHEMKDHVLLFSDGVVCKYAAQQKLHESGGFDSWIHFLSVMPDLPMKLSERAAELSEDRIQSLLDVMIDVHPFEPIEARIDAKNAELRAEFLHDFPVLDSTGVHKLAGLKGTNTSQTVNTWRQKGRILGILVQGKNAYPRFQFDADGQPLALMEPVLGALPASFTAWQRAFWFVSPKETLDGKTPAEAVRAGDDRVVETARVAGELVAG
ncbi:hypothetical protein [Sulfitobacter noctilucae]|uniref:hypothetical protein n=1 Tax=Sulfitobacter noctilucae TaxID=1342302 RepID=UPI0004697521|nr:hypothetical protein [Sulfitobacter noctilucae]